MFINKNGWPVVAPHRYAPTTDKTVTAEQLAGSYKLIEHGKDISAQIKNSVSVNLLANGSISGDKTGSWVSIWMAVAVLKAWYHGSGMKHQPNGL
jgi:arabinan endo-1,5-alpha-L-arabinosidase